jgi:sugar phosphate isomerase/epimerase
MKRWRGTRRKFLADAGCLCGSLALVNQFGPAAAAAEKPPTWPIACRDSMLRYTGHKDCWSALQAVGAEGLEIMVADDLTLPYLFHPTTKYTLATEAGKERLLADAHAAGQRVAALLMVNRFEERPDFEVRWCAETAASAQAIGAAAIRIDVQRQKLAPEEFLKQAIETLKKVAAAVEPTGAALAIENHGATTNAPEFLKALFAGVGSKRLGLTLDTANIYGAGHPLSKVYEFCEAFASRVFHTHCKSIHYPAEDRERPRPRSWKYREYACPIDEGDIDFVRVVAALQKAGYAGSLCVEDEFLAGLSPDAATKRLARQLQFLKALRAKSLDEEGRP